MRVTVFTPPRIFLMLHHFLQAFTLMLIEELPYHDPNEVLGRMPPINLAFLDSAMQHPTLGRYSYIGVDPFAMLSLPVGATASESLLLADIEHSLRVFAQPEEPHLPPFQGGLMGYFSYDLAFLLEPAIQQGVTKQKFNYDYYQLGCFDLVLSFDHLLRKAWIISTGFPELQSDARRERAKKRLNWIKRHLNTPAVCFTSARSRLAIPRCHMGRTGYLEKIKRVMDYISQGDIFQANFARCYQAELPDGCDAMALYYILRRVNPAPFSSFFNFSPCRILSSSPERFIKIARDTIETRPIKGTIHRHASEKEDAQCAQILLGSAKDRAENTMIVDLMRNDLSKICLPQSIEVPQWCALESYETVHHLVSVVRGILYPGTTTTDVLKATFPGGSITGAPKIRAIEIISELETVERGPYCGAIGYIGFNGQMDTSISIRTLLVNHNRLLFHTGSGITLASDPEQEYQETVIKAQALKKACETYIEVGA